MSNIVFMHGTNKVMTTANRFDNVNRLTGISSVAYGTNVASFQYQYNLASQRTKVTLLDGSYWIYAYDPLGQVTSAKKYFWDGTPYPGQQFGFGFDTIGNRLSTLAGGDETGATGAMRQANYTNNLLNQITSRDVPGYVDIMGLALATNTVNVNGSNAYRKWEYFREQLPVNNSSNALWTNITVTSPGQATNSGSLFVAQTPESFGYDLDGNQLSDGRFTYTWDGENRLISAASLTNAPVASMSSNVFTYDYMGRRIQKVLWTNSGSAWVLSYTNKFVYDGWNVVAILDGSNNPLYTCTWGTDLSGTMQGAGGVGGLLSITVCTGTNAGTYFPCYDGNGNVVALVNATNGAIACNYEYGPFGELIRATGPMAKLNPFMFSTKFYDWETGLYYYGHRYYNPSTGRWLSRDAEEEDGGLNLYGFVGNNPIDSSDPFGLWTVQRNNQIRAEVVADKCGDSLLELAKLVRLDDSQYRYWLKPTKNYPDFDDRLKFQSQIERGDVFTIPNVVLAVQGYALLRPTTFILRAYMDATSYMLTRQVFLVSYYDRNIQQFNASTIEDWAGAGNLWGFVFYGHGRVTLLNTAMGGQFVIKGNEIINSFDMQGWGKDPQGRYSYGLVVAYFCSAVNDNWLSLLSQYGVGYQSQGVFQGAGLDWNSVATAIDSAGSAW